MEESEESAAYLDVAIEFLKKYGWAAVLVIGACAAGWQFIRSGYYPRIGLSDLTAVFVGGFFYTALFLVAGAVACLLPSQLWLWLADDYEGQGAGESGKKVHPAFTSQEAEGSPSTRKKIGRLARLIRYLSGERPTQEQINSALLAYLLPMLPVLLLWPLWSIYGEIDSWTKLSLGLTGSLLFLGLFACRSRDTWKQRRQMFVAYATSAGVGNFLLWGVLFPLLGEAPVFYSKGVSLTCWRLILVVVAAALFGLVSLVRTTDPSVPAWRMFGFSLIVVSLVFTLTIPRADAGVRVMFRHFGFGNFDASLVVSQDVATSLRAAGATVECPPSQQVQAIQRCLYSTHIISALGEEYYVEDPISGYRIAISRSKTEAMVRRKTN